MTRKALDRRTLLRGLGTAIALPALDAMTPVFAAAPKMGPGATPVRMAFVYVPNGVIMDDWTPTGTGRAANLPSTLAPLNPVRESVNVLSGLAQINGRALGDGPGDHARAASTFLTGVHPKKTNGADISVGISCDQVAAQKIGGQTRFASLELGTEPGRLAGNCDSGYSCAYSNSISWRTENTPNPPEIDPRLVFERLFGDFASGEDTAARANRRNLEKSILDFVQDDTRALKRELGATDNQKLDEYLHGIRSIEERIEKAESSPQIDPGMSKPDGIPVEFSEHLTLMFDLLAAAFRTDSTRVATLMIGREGSNRTYREIGVPDAHHGMSHHRNDEEKIRRLAKINRFHMEHFARFLGQLRTTEEPNGQTLLDNTMIVYGSGLSDGNRHRHEDLPVLLAGRAGGKIRGGEHRVYAEETPLNNLFLSMLDRVGVPVEDLGDSTGKLQGLAGI